MSGPPWVLPTATSRYVVGWAADAGPVLQDWTAGEVRDWQPAAAKGFDTELDRVPSEFSTLGGRQVCGADLIVDHGDSLVGARLVWDLASAELVSEGAATRFTVAAGDTTGDLGVRVTIRTSDEHDVVGKWVELTNTGDQVLTLPRAFGPAWELPVGPGATVDYLAGDWSREFTPGRVTLDAGEFSIGSRSGITSHRFSPVVTVRGQDDIEGPAYGIALAWSGSWRLLVEVPPFRDRVRVAGGVDDESCVVTLDPGESFTTPETLGVFAPDGATGVTRRWHDYQRGWLSRSRLSGAPATGSPRGVWGVVPPHRHRLSGAPATGSPRGARGVVPPHRQSTHHNHPVVYNSWYATTFDVEVDHQIALAEVAATLGVEVFVIDDGWFRGRNSDRAGLGDWTPDPVKFPDGLDPLVSAVVERGMRFGVWVEPEAVNLDSDLFRAHPDWVYAAGDRPLVTHRHQYVLDFGRPEVVAWTQDWLRALLADKRISYLKWDMNRTVSDGGRPGDPHGRQWAVQHTLGYYAVLDLLRAEFPHVTLEACSGGGGRIDAGVLARCDVVWPSDETGARDRLAIQHGFLTAYGPHLMSSWVTDEPSSQDTEPTSFEFRFVVAMAGVLGIGSDLLDWSESDRARAAELVRLYRDIRETVFRGRVEQHGRPADPVYAVEYGDEDQTVVLVYGRASRSAEARIAPRTLDPGRSYRLRGQGTERSGADWASGLVVPFALAGDTDVLVFDPAP